MSGQNNQIIASDYNTIQSKINTVLGTGSLKTGYGQVVNSSQVTQNSKITVAQWNTLRNEIVKCRQHQTGVTMGTKAPEDFGYVAGTDLPVPTQSSQVKESWRNAYFNAAVDAETWQSTKVAGNLSLAPPVGQGTVANLLSTDQVRNQYWNNRITQVITMTFDTANEARYFWNTGGEIRIESSRTGGSAGLKNTTWTTMLTNMGTIIIDYTNTTCTGTGTTSTIGWYDLTTDDNLLFEKDAPAGSYADNKFYIYGRVNSTSDRRIGYFTLTWADDSGKPPSYPDPGFGVDENVDGTLTSSIKSYRATGDNVSVLQPSTGTSPIA